MKEIKFVVNFGGYVGTEEEHSIYVNDDATEFEIESAVQDEFEQIIMDNCSWEFAKDDEEDV